MKRMLTVVFVCAVLILSMSTTEVFSASKIFLGDDVSFQAYIPFGFQVPMDMNQNGEVVETQEFVRGYWGQPGSWEHKIPGENVSRGFYRFKIPKSIISISLFGELNASQQVRTWSAFEIEPDEVGLLVEGMVEPKNVFRLPTDDTVASYFLLMPNPGMNVTLGGILRKTNFIYMSGGLYGVIISDSRGFLRTRLTGQKLKKNLNKIIVKDTDIVVLEYR